MNNPSTIELGAARPVSRRLAGGLIATSALLVGLDAQAAGFATARFGGELGNAMTNSPTAIYYNPAGIALSEGLNVFVDGTTALRSLSFDRRPNANAPGEVPEPADASGANSGKSSLFNVVAAPMLGATFQNKVSESIGLAGGLAMFVPFGGSAVWDKNDAFANNAKYPGPADGTQRYHTIHGSIRSLYISAAAAINYKNYVSFGLSGGVSQNSIDSVRARDVAVDTNLDNEGRAWLKAKNTTAQLGAGVMITPFGDKDRLRIGLSYQASPGFGPMALKGLLQKYFAGTLSGERAGTDDVELHQTLPDIYRIGMSYRPRRDLELRGQFDYTRWSLFQDQCITNAGESCEISHGDDGLKDGQPKPGSENVSVNLPRRFSNSVSARVGASYWPTNENLELYLGVGIDQHAIPNETVEPSMVDFDSLSTAVGARARFTKHLQGSLTYTQFFYASRDTTGLSNLANYAAPSNSPDSGGIYKQSIGVIDVNFQASFDPCGQQVEQSERLAEKSAVDAPVTPAPVVAPVVVPEAPAPVVAPVVVPEAPAPAAAPIVVPEAPAVAPVAPAH